MGSGSEGGEIKLTHYPDAESLLHARANAYSQKDRPSTVHSQNSDT
jgi:hypothetical protein